jgi:hypothetical protein
MVTRFPVPPTCARACGITGTPVTMRHQRPEASPPAGLGDLFAVEPAELRAHLRSLRLASRMLCPSARTRGYSRSWEKARAFSAPAPLTRSSPAEVPLSTAPLGRLRGWLASKPYSQGGAERGRSRFRRLHSGPRTGRACRDDAYVAHSLVLRSLKPWPPLPLAWSDRRPRMCAAQSAAPTGRGALPISGCFTPSNHRLCHADFLSSGLILDLGTFRLLRSASPIVLKGLRCDGEVRTLQKIKSNNQVWEAAQCV